MNAIKILLFALPVLFYGCEEDDLTEIKFNGTGGMSCLVDGKVMNNVSKNTFCEFVLLNDGIQALKLGFSDDDINNYTFEFIDLQAYAIDTDNLEGVVFLMGGKETSESYGVYQFGSSKYKTNSMHTGELKVLYFDRVKNVIGGTFWFDAVNNGERVNIRDGRFDIPVKNVQKRIPG
ncbi:hypothetical protein [Lutimonas vermicola]|uniref:Lipoprotein n=1 Tax=Lutimonas vermicola TaxID=414288 RepID=A0ABU9L210_9FLAO